MFNELAYHFSYLDLVCTDCGIFDESVSNYLMEAGRKEYSLFARNERTDRVAVRLDRVAKFLDYLKAEEMRERELYALGMPELEMFTAKSLGLFAAEKERVLTSAKKQSEKRRNRHRRTAVSRPDAQ